MTREQPAQQQEQVNDPLQRMAFTKMSCEGHGGQSNFEIMKWVCDGFKGHFAGPMSLHAQTESGALCKLAP